MIIMRVFNAIEEVIGKTLLLAVMWIAIALLLLPSNAKGATITIRALSNCHLGNVGACTGTPVRNVSQVQHTIVATFTDNGGSCTVAATNSVPSGVWIEASMDGSNYFTLGQAQMVANNIGMGIGNGTFPFIRVKAATPSVNCKVDVMYTGNTTPVPQSQNALLSGFKSISNNVNTISPIQAMGAYSYARIAVYGVYLHNSSLARKSVQVHAADITGTPINGTVVSIANMAPGESLSIGFGDQALFISPVNNSIWVSHTLVAGEVNPIGALDYAIQYRVE